MSPGKGRGTTVRVELPLMIVHDSRSPRDEPRASGDRSAASARARSSPTSAAVACCSSMTTPTRSRWRRDALAIAGATVVTASNGADALAALDRETFDVAILDIGLPEHGRLRVAEGDSARGRTTGRATSRPPRSPRTLAPSIARARLQAGFQMHLSKPIQPSELAAAVLALSGRIRDYMSRRG